MATDPEVVNNLEQWLLQVANDPKFLDALRELLALQKGLPVTRTAMRRVVAAFQKLGKVSPEGFDIARLLLHELPEEETQQYIITVAPILTGPGSTA